MFRLILLLILSLMPVNAWCVTQWHVSSLPATGDTLASWPADVNAQWSITDTLVSNYRRGYNLSYSSASTIVAGAGEIVVSNALGTTRLFLKNTSTSNVTFSNIDTGAEASATTYYVYCGTNSATASSCTFYVTTSSSAPTGITYYARLGSFYNDASSNITLINNDNRSDEIGEKVSKSVDTIYQATTDGFVSYTGTFSASQQVILYTDSSSTPTTNVSQLAAGSGFSSTYRGSIFFPIKAGDYYKVSVVSGSPTTENYYFIPLI